MYKTILVPLDGSEDAEIAVPHAAALADAFDARVVVLEVGPGYGRTVGAIIAEAFGAAGSVEAMVEVGEAREELAEDYLEALRQSQGRPDWMVEVAEGNPADVIAERAAELGADLVVMATHGRSRLARSILGSVSDEVIRHAPCPVLVIRIDDD